MQGKQTGGTLLALVLILVSFMVIVLISSHFDSQQSIENAERQRAAQERLAKEESERKKTAVAYFASHKAELIEDIKNKIDRGEYNTAYHAAIAYNHIDDKDLHALIDKAHELKLVDELKKIPASQYKANRDKYQILVNLRPDNHRYKAKLDYYQEKLLAEEAKKIWYGDPPTRSGWDGSYLPVKMYLRRIANDPDSIEFENCTKVFKTKEGWLVGCIYRGNNAFGAKVMNANWFTIRQDRVVKMEDQNRYKWQ